MNNDDFLAAKMDFISPVNFTNNDICVKLRENFTEVNVTLFKAFGCEELHAPQFTDRTLIKVFVLSVMGVISLVGNVATIWNIQKNRSSRRALRHSCSSIYTLILHLSVADILVTFFCIIGEAIWSYTVEWFADEISCKLLKFLQMFALYLSTLVLVLIGIDRWIAVKYPMKSKLLKTSRFVVVIYIISLILSLPQGFIFHLERGPFIEEFYQCVTFGFYTADWQEQLYTSFTLVFMFIIPLVILAASYISTFHTIASSERMFKFEASMQSNNVRRSDSNRQKLIHKAKMKSFRISVVIVAAFIICWTPYYAMMLIFMFMNPDERLSDDLQSGIFFFGMSNSLINPLIYGFFHTNQPMRRRRQYLQARDGSVLHRSLSTNATTCRTLNNFHTQMNVPKYQHQNHHYQTTLQHHHNDSSIEETTRVQNMEEICLMSLENDLKNLDEENNQNIRLKSRGRFTENFIKFFNKRSNFTRH